MQGWRGVLMAKIPASLLRVVFDRLSATRNREPTYASGTSAEVMRQRNQSTLRAALASAGLTATPVFRAGEPALFLRRADLPAMGELRSIAARAGLRLLDSTTDRHGLRFLAAKDGTSGQANIDRALAALLVADADSAQLADADSAQSAVTDILEPDFEIDLVYTWVDGDDPAWRERRRAAMSGARSGLPPTSNDVGRFTSHDELRHSLRSVAYFAPWVRRIHIVTAGQVPGWLKTGDDRIRLVDHTEIFKQAKNLPTFNSHAIEAQLHRIPGLAEHFIYMNDDVFFGQTVCPGDFFTPGGQSRFFLSTNSIRPPSAGELPVDIAARNNRCVIEQRFGKTTSQKFLHAPHAQRRSTLELIEREQARAVAKTAAATFRSRTDLSIPSSLAHYYGLALGIAVPSAIDYNYVDISAPRAQIQLLRLMRGIPSVFCLNEVEAKPGRSAEVTGMLSHFLQSVFPIPSSIEIEAGNSGSEEAHLNGVPT